MRIRHFLLAAPLALGAAALACSHSGKTSASSGQGTDQNISQYAGTENTGRFTGSMSGSQTSNAAAPQGDGTGVSGPSSEPKMQGRASGTGSAGAAEGSAGTSGTGYSGTDVSGSGPQGIGSSSDSSGTGSAGTSGPPPNGTTRFNRPIGQGSSGTSGNGQ